MPITMFVENKNQVVCDCSFASERIANRWIQNGDGFEHIACFDSVREETPDYVQEFLDLLQVETTVHLQYLPQYQEMKKMVEAFYALYRIALEKTRSTEAVKEKKEMKSKIKAIMKMLEMMRAEGCEAPPLDAMSGEGHITKLLKNPKNMGILLKWMGEWMAKRGK